MQKILVEMLIANKSRSILLLTSAEPVFHADGLSVTEFQHINSEKDLQRTISQGTAQSKLQRKTFSSTLKSFNPLHFFLGNI